MIKKTKNLGIKLLKWVEKWAETDMTYLAKGSFWTTAVLITSNISSVFLALAFANFLSKEAYGTYQYIMSLVGLFSIPTLSGMGSAIIKSVSRGNEGDLSPALYSKIKWGAWGGIASAFLATYYLINNNATLGLSFLIIAIFIPLFLPFSIYSPFLSGKKLFKNNAYASFFSTIVFLPSLFLTLFLTDSVPLIIFVYFFTQTLANIILFIHTKNKFQSNKKTSSDTINFGKHLTAMNIMEMIGDQLDRILLWHFVGPIELAIYSFAVTPVNQAKALFKQVSNLALPKFSVNEISIIKKTLPKKILKLTIISSVTAIIYAFFSPYLFRILFPQYLDSIIYSQLLSILIALYPLTLFNTALVAHAKKKTLYYTSFFSSFIKIILLCILLPFWGIWGIIASFILTRLVTTIVQIYFFFKTS